MFWIGIVLTLVAGLLRIDYIKKLIERKINFINTKYYSFILLFLLLAGVTTSILGYVTDKTSLSIYKVERNDSNGIVIVDVYLISNKNEPLGILAFRVDLPRETDVKITEFIPVATMISAGEKISEIAPDGKSATMQYMMIGQVNPIIEITLTGETEFTIKGSYGLSQHITLEQLIPR